LVSGGQAESGDAAQSAQPALARGEAAHQRATTWSESTDFEKDPAPGAALSAVQLHGPSISEAVTILRGLAPV